jgi:hypothetical protein
MITNDANSYGNNRFKIVFNKLNTGVRTTEEKNKNVLLYPNPSSDVIYLKDLNGNMNSPECSYQLFDVLGNKITDGELLFTNNFSSINIHELQTGIYFLHILNDGQLTVSKFMKK